MLVKAYSRIRSQPMIQAIKLAHRGVGVDVGRAGDGNHGGELGVAKAGEGADDGDQHHGEGQSGTCAGTAVHGGVLQTRNG